VVMIFNQAARPETQTQARQANGTSQNTLTPDAARTQSRVPNNLVTFPINGC
jgi:hypothetical protein